MKISIIIPAYNAEKHLERCIKSVLAALAEARGVRGEIIVVDNGSSDKTLTIAQKWRKIASIGATVKNISDSAPSGAETPVKTPPVTIHVLQCHTPGAAAARNFGAAKAIGEFIWFIDADDYTAPEAARDLLACSTGVDLVMMGAQRLRRDGPSSYLSAVDPAQSEWKSRFIRYGMGPWQVLIRRKWWLEHSLAFPEGIIHEDMALMSALVLYTDRLASVDKPLYCYCETPGSVLHKRKFSPHIFDIFPALEGLYARFKKEPASTEYGSSEATAADEWHDELEWFFIWNLLIDSAKDFGAWAEGRPGYARARRMLRSYFPAWRKNRFLREKPLKLRLRVRANYHKK